MTRAVVVGRSTGALEEYAAAKALCAFDATIVVGKMGEVFPDPIDYWVTFHTNLFDRWAERRAARGLPAASNFWGAIYRGRALGADETRCGPLAFVLSAGGSSGFLAVEGAHEKLQATHVVLAGIPLTAEGSHIASAAEPHEVDAKWLEADAYWATWLENVGRLRGKVKSMSGRTRELLGEPTREWLRGRSDT